MYQLRPPDPALQPFVEHYWFVTPDGAPTDLQVDVFVDGRADLLFNFGAPYQRQVIGREATQHAHSNLDAQRVVPIRIVQRGQVRITGVRFRLGGLGAFTRVPLRAFTNQTPAPSDVLGDDARALEAALSATPDVEAQARLLDRFLLAQRSEGGSFEDFSRALRALTDAEGTASVEEVSKAAAMSSRHLDRLFARHLGIPPKTVGRVLRFQRTLRALMRDPGCSLADVATQAGYFDQAHFIKDFKRMSGGVPRGYRGYYPPEAPRDFAPNVVVFLQDGPRRRG
jgi:AraC-like DNA-binding protein